MNEQKNFLKSCLDGYVQSFILNCLILVYSSNLVLYEDWFALIWFLSPIIPAIAYYFLMKKESKKLSITIMSAISGMSFITFQFLSAVVKLIFGPAFSKILPIRDVQSSEGVWFIFMIIVFVILSFIAKLIIFIILLVKNRKNKGANL